jgi:hypothetical protein
MLLVGLVACSSQKKEVEEPPVQENDAPPSLDEVHDALVAIHKRATEECFGGFGKGAPYSMSLKIGKGKIVGAQATPLSDKHGPFPTDCVQDEFTGSDLAGTDRNELSARFAVDNPDCDLPACPENDLPCTFKRDIACTVVIED